MLEIPQNRLEIYKIKPQIYYKQPQNVNYIAKKCIISREFDLCCKFLAPLIIWFYLSKNAIYLMIEILTLVICALMVI
jgi:hypothetical protein